MMAQLRRVRFHVSLVWTIVLIVVVLSGAALAIVITVGDRSIDQAVDREFSRAQELAYQRITAVMEEAQDIAAMNAVATGLRDTTEDPLDHPGAPLFLEQLRRSETLYSVYIGYDDGRFFQLIKAENDPGIIASLEAPAGTMFIFRSISAPSPSGQRRQEWRFVGADGSIVGSRGDQNTPYDPRTRPWYQDSDHATATVQFSRVYRFNSLDDLGITAARRLEFGEGTIGVDLTLGTLQAYLQTHTASPNGGILIVDDQDRIIAGNTTFLDTIGAVTDQSVQSIPFIAQFLDSDRDSDRSGSDSPQNADLHGEKWLMQSIAIDSPQDDHTGLSGWTLVLGAPEYDFLGPFTTIKRRILWLTLIVLVIAIPLVFLTTHRATRVIDALAAEASRIQNLDFTEATSIESPIYEFHQLSLGFQAMRRHLQSRTVELNASMDRLAKIIELNIAISAEQNIDRLSELILQGAQELSHADGGSLYLKNEQTRALDFIIVLNDTLGFVQGGTSGNAVTLPSVPLYDEEGNPNEHNVVSYTVHNEATVNIPDAYNAVGFDFSGTRRFDESNGYRSQSFLTVPLKPRGSEIIGAIQLLNAKDPETGETVEFSSEIQRFVEALAAGAATALYNRDLIEEQRRLFDAMIQLIAGAIDAKSPYTGGHCARVPEIALMIAHKAHETTDGPLGGFRFDSDHDWRAFRIGAWLHDAGKVTTPDYVVDKATKLETIYNRIHEIRTRFEVLLRDARIARHEAVIGGADPVAEDQKLAAEEEALQEEYAFIAECNLGGEFLAPDRMERLKQIAQRRWMRYFDDSIGLSWSENLRRDRRDEMSLPAEEPLLADRPDHIIPRTDDFYRQYEKFGFTIPVPENLYNLGELYNLSVGRGTLTEEERFKINEHVMQTILMLDRLPFPKNLENVPEYAGTHHEALNGTGYPKQLTGDDLSIPARIMAIADIFEALTASDRPYKKAKPLSVAVDILSKFKEEGHIDPDIFDLFLRSGIYREYAERYLRPEQVDEVDISKYLG